MFRKIAFTAVFGLAAVVFAGYGILNAQSAPNEGDRYVDKLVEGDLDKIGYDSKLSDLDKVGWLDKEGWLGGGLL